MPELSRVLGWRLKEECRSVRAVPSFLHEALLLLFRNRPELAAELLRDALGVELPAYTEARIESAELTDIEPAARYADLVVLLVDGKPVLGIVVEVQLAPDEGKRFTWPVYVANLRARIRCDVELLVFTPDSKTATWAARPIRLGEFGMVRPFVVGPEGVPVVDDLAAAKHHPELAVLSAMAHGHGDVEAAVRLALVALEASSETAARHFAVYYDLVVSALSEAARKAFEMLPQQYQFQDESLRRSFDKGRAQASAESVIAFLEARKIAVSDEQRQRVLDCADLAKLESWVRKAAIVSTAAELFED